MRSILYKYKCKDGYEYIGEGFLPKKIWINLTYNHGGIIYKIVYATFGRH